MSRLARALRVRAVAAASAMLGVTCVALTGCTAFALPRPAQVRPGPSLSLSLAAATPPGDAASWFWSVYCVSSCNHAMFAPAVTAMYGMVGEDSVGVAEVGVGVNGFAPFVEAYRRVGSGTGRAFGFGARVGAFASMWEFQVYSRINLRSDEEQTTFVNPTWMGHFQGGQWFQGIGAVVGLHETTGGRSITLALTPVVGWVHRSEFAPEDEQSAFSGFLVLSASYTLHGE